MKKINKKQIKLVLIDLKADTSTTELILNNVDLYNDLVKDYNDDNKQSTYLMYQLNQLIVKQIRELKIIKIRTANLKNNESSNNKSMFELEFNDDE